MLKDFNEYKINKDKLIQYGFVLENNVFELERLINNKLIAKFRITEENFNVKVFDKTTLEEYLPYNLLISHGNYVTDIRSKVEKITLDIIEKCFEKDCISEKIIKYTQEKYQTIPEHPWPETPSAFTLKTNNKWYGLYMKIPYKSLKINQEGEVEILNLKNAPQKIQNIIDNKTYFPAYHMNKKHWFTIILTNKTNFKELYQLIDESYNLVNK